jgi:hypothetical protein
MFDLYHGSTSRGVEIAPSPRKRGAGAPLMLEDVSIRPIRAVICCSSDRESRNLNYLILIPFSARAQRAPDLPRKRGEGAGVAAKADVLRHAGQ